MRFGAICKEASSGTSMDNGTGNNEIKSEEVYENSKDSALTFEARLGRLKTCCSGVGCSVWK